jgi:hypothetical protein
MRRRKPDPPGLMRFLKQTLEERGEIGLAVAVDLLPDEETAGASACGKNDSSAQRDGVR